RSPSRTSTPMVSRVWPTPRRRSAGNSCRQQFEGVTRLVAREDRDAPEHAKRLDRAGGFGTAHVGGFPAELIDDLGDRLFCGLIVAADEHGGAPALELRIHHAPVTD